METSWSSEWPLLLQALLRELPSSALDELCLCFDDKDAASLQQLFEKLNNRSVFTGSRARDNVAKLLHVIASWPTGKAGQNLEDKAEKLLKVPSKKTSESEYHLPAFPQQMFVQIVSERIGVWPHVKVQVLGDAAHGKTSFVRWLVGENANNKGREETRSLDISVVEAGDNTWVVQSDVLKQSTELSVLIRARMNAKYSTESAAMEEMRIRHPPTRAEMEAMLETLKEFEKVPIPPLPLSCRETLKARIATHTFQTGPKPEEIKQAMTPRLYVWDFAGQEDYYNTHHIFISEGAIHVLVIKMTNNNGEVFVDEKRVRFWLLSIRAYAPSSEIFVLGTHSDRIPRAHRADNVSKWKELLLDALKTSETMLSSRKTSTRKEQHEMIEVISCINDGDEVRRRIQTRLMKMARWDTSEETEAGVPRKPLIYMLLFDILQHAAKRFPLQMLHLQEAITLGRSIGVNQTDITNALTFFDHLGLILYRKESPQIADFIFMAAQELVNTLRCFIAPQTHKEIYSSITTISGHFTDVEGEKVLQTWNSEYTQEHWRIVRNVLLHFGLAFERDLRTIVPCLIEYSKQARDTALQCLNTPSSLVTSVPSPTMRARVVPQPLSASGRLIVALLQQDRSATLYWNGGCCVSVHGCHAVVEFDVEHLGVREQALRALFEEARKVYSKEHLVIEYVSCLHSECTGKITIPTELQLDKWYALCNRHRTSFIARTPQAALPVILSPTSYGNQSPNIQGAHTVTIQYGFNEDVRKNISGF